jgi:predicted metalloprotease with PDZ domain
LDLLLFVEGVENGVAQVEEIQNVVNDTKQEEDVSFVYFPRLCHIKKWPDFQRYGFDLLTKRDRKGQFICQIYANSPVEAGGLKYGDRIIEVNGDNVEDDSHEQVIQRIKAGGDQLRMLVLDKVADEYYRGQGISVNARMSCVKYMTTPDRSKCQILVKKNIKSYCNDLYV